MPSDKLIWEEGCTGDTRQNSGPSCWNSSECVHVEEAQKQTSSANHHPRTAHGTESCRRKTSKSLTTSGSERLLGLVWSIKAHRNRLVSGMFLPTCLQATCQVCKRRVKYQLHGLVMLIPVSLVHLKVPGSVIRTGHLKAKSRDGCGNSKYRLESARRL